MAVTGDGAIVVRRVSRRLLTACLMLSVVGTGCRIPLAGDRPDAGAGPTGEEFLAAAEAYLEALRVGDLDDAWARVCQSGFGASDRDTFDAHHTGAPRPTSWTLTYEESGSGAGRSARPGGAGGTPPGAAGTVELDDGTRGELRLLYGSEGLCQVIGDGPVVRAIDPAP